MHTDSVEVCSKRFYGDSLRHYGMPTWEYMLYWSYERHSHLILPMLDQWQALDSIGWSEE